MEQKQEFEDNAKILKNLNLEPKDVENLEWEGALVTKKPQLDSDDDEDPDPIAILASTNSVRSSRKIVKRQKTPKSLITENDLLEVQNEINKLNLDPILENVCQREKLESDFRFLPHKNAKIRESSEQTKSRDVTAAAPPVIKKGVQMLSLRESIEVESSNRAILKEVTEKHAAERLAMREKNLREFGMEPTKTSPQKSSNPLSMTKYRLPRDNMDEILDDASNDSYESALSDDFDE